ncbi:peptide deformylase [Methylobacter sp. YRD-M1]|uniref:peptide deformylase n=1 Tax=Methylobacter sp. YRD-M1 TaxID=2911520 RepID=UPI00227AC10A|nr:peptide deformylase [Methylobacter sp. YRD-M1]WAK04098.1 peptide deformylase [Methylobacter sp. YRD-M1]
MREIVQLGAEVLRKKAAAVVDVHDDDIRRIIADMQSTLAGTQGVGIAAPQISESKRIIIVASRPTPRYPRAPQMEPTVMINPVFEVLSDHKEKDWEGCLSIPGIRALVPRYREILIRYTDQHGGSVELKLEGFVARIFQHEYDHLEGRVYLDSVEDNRDIFSEKEYFKLMEGR